MEWILPELSSIQLVQCDMWNWTLGRYLAAMQRIYNGWSGARTGGYSKTGVRVHHCNQYNTAVMFGMQDRACGLYLAALRMILIPTLVDGGRL
jgi:hypothetical protein